MSKMLDQALSEYAASDAYPFHMPGHKRQNMGIGDPYQIDITEIHNFDNLHEPQGVIKEAMEHLAELYGSRQSYFLINGSTCGNLAAVFAASGCGDELMIGRNSHRSVYHAAILRRNRLHYLYPAPAAQGILQGEIRAADVREALERHPLTKAVLITSPTYEGVVSDVGAIAEICHAHGVPLIVDAAHGAHLGFHPYFPPSPVQKGADLVIMSLHKTLPSLTQTAVLHLQGNRIRRDVCEKYLRMFQSSSPSYVLMSGMVKCIRYLEQQGEEAFARFEERLEAFYRGTEDLRYLQIWNPRMRRDPSKIVILCNNSGMTGEQLSRKLREQFSLELEMSESDYALAMTSIMDSEQGFERLADALHEIDAGLTKRAEEAQNKKGRQRAGLQKTAFQNAQGLQNTEETPAKEKDYEAPAMELWEADEAKAELTSLEEAAGCVAAEFISVYPPGIPVLVPGERVRESQVEQIRRSFAHELTVQGLHQRDDRIYIKTVSKRK